MKTCTKCHIKKALSEFHVDRSRRDGRVFRCKTCIAQYSKARYLRNPAYLCAQAKKYRDENYIKVKEARRRYTERNKDIIKVKKSSYARHNRVKYNFWYSQYRAAKMSGVLCKIFQKEILNIYRNANMLTNETGVRHEVDHIIPVRGKNVCGLHVPWNLQVIPWQDNRRKWNHVSYTKLRGGKST